MIRIVHSNKTKIFPILRRKKTEQLLQKRKNCPGRQKFSYHSDCEEEKKRKKRSNNNAEIDNVENKEKERKQKEDKEKKKRETKKKRKKDKKF